MRFSLCFSIACLGITAIMSTPAKADLIGTGANTVDPIFYVGAQIAADSEDEGTKTIVSGGTSYGPGANSETGILVTGSQIKLTNDASLPYCSSTVLPCSDSFTGFEFVFSSAVDITGVSVDASSAADFQPVSLSLVSATDLLVNLTGLAPGVGDFLTIDFTFPSSSGGGTTSTPEPMSAALLGAGLVGLLIAKHRRQASHRGTPAQR